MKFNGQEFVLNTSPNAPSLGEQLFAKAHAIPSTMERGTGGFDLINPPGEETGYSRSEIEKQTDQTVCVFQHGIATTNSSSPMNVLATDGMGPCVTPIAYAPGSKVGAMAHIDPGTDLNGFANEFMKGFPGDEPIVIDFVGGGKNAISSRTNLMNSLVELYNHPNSQNIDIRSFDVMEKAHCTAVALDTKTGHLYPDHGTSTQTLDTAFRMMPTKDHATDEKPYFAKINDESEYCGVSHSTARVGGMACESDPKMKRQFDGTDIEAWKQQEVVALKKAITAHVISKLDGEIPEQRQEQIANAVGEMVDNMTAGRLDAIEGMENQLKGNMRVPGKQGFGLDSTQRWQETSLFTSIANELNQNPELAPAQAVNQGVAQWKQHHAGKLATAVFNAGYDNEPTTGMQEGLEQLLSNDEPLMLALSSHPLKLEGEPQFIAPPSQEKLTPLVKTSQCLESMVKERRMSPQNQKMLSGLVAPEMHRQFQSNPNLSPSRLGKAISKDVIKEDVMEKQKMKPAVRVGDFLQHRKIHKPMFIGTEFNVETAQQSVKQCAEKLGSKGLTTGDSIDISSGQSNSQSNQLKPNHTKL